MKTIVRRIFPVLLALLFVLSGCAFGAGTETGTESEKEIEPVTTEPAVTEQPETFPPETEPETETEATEPPETEPPLPPEPKRVSFLAAGDSIIHEGIYLEAAKMGRLNGEGRAYDFSHIFPEVKDEIAGADIAFINQETLMAGEEYGYTGYPQFNSPRDLAVDLLNTGFDVVNLANNHMYDKGAAGLRATLDYWHTLDCTVIGAYYDEADYNSIRIVERDGVRIAFLSYFYGTNTHYKNTPRNVPGTDMIFPNLWEEDIRRQTAAAEELADFTVVSVHWGEDSVQAVTDDQKHFAKLFADCGVDVIVGHHPHLIQPVEWIEGKDGNRCLCAYSLGNLYSLMASSYNMVGGFLECDFVVGEEGARIENARFVPTLFYYKTSFFGQHLYFMKNITEQLCESHGTKNFGGKNATAAELVSYTKKIIPEEFLLPDAFPEGY